MTLDFRVEFLVGTAVAGARNNSEEHEWPPHPDRLFMTLVAAYKECGFGTAEREALLWLEQQGPPEIRASNALTRRVVKVYVPPNDVAAPDRVPRAGFSKEQIAKGLEVLPERRQRKERFLPAVIPYEPIVHFVWPTVDPREFVKHSSALARLAAAVTYLGHSSSLVAVAVFDEAVESTHAPTPEGELLLRVATPGRLEWLESEYQPSKPRRPPPAAPYYSYTALRRLASDAPHSIFDGRFVVYRKVSGPELPLPAVLKLTSAVRDALLSRSEQPPPEVLSGHKPDGSPSERPHLAILPLAFVDHRYADGRIMGFGFVLPRDIAIEERKTVFGAIRGLGDSDELKEIKLGRAGVWVIERLATELPQRSLQSDQYLGPATQWASITPMIFGHFPKSLWYDEAKQIVARSCEMIGLRAPSQVRVCDISPILGTQPSFRFPTLSTAGKLVGVGFAKGRHQPPRKDAEGNPARLRAHVILEFDEPVCGPVIIGAGRYFGMGLCRPLR